VFRRADATAARSAVAGPAGTDELPGVAVAAAETPALPTGEVSRVVAARAP